MRLVVSGSRRCVASRRVSATVRLVEGGAPRHVRQCGGLRTSRSIVQCARSAGGERDDRSCSLHVLRTLNAESCDPLSIERMEAETSDPNRCDIHRSAPEPITTKQLNVLVKVEQWIDGHGWPPSLSELCGELRIASKDTVRGHLKALERKGYLRHDAGEHRGLRVLIPSSRAVVQEPKGIRKTVHLCDRCRREVG